MDTGAYYDFSVYRCLHFIFTWYMDMKLVYGKWGYENLAPERLLGFYWDINHDGSWVAAFCLWKWYIGIKVKGDDNSYENQRR